jgi:hypothetical protein
LLIGVALAHTAQGWRKENVMILRSLSWEIGAALFFKVLALVFLYFAFFSGSHRSAVTPNDVAAFLVDQHSTSQ